MIGAGVRGRFAQDADAGGKAAREATAVRAAKTGSGPQCRGARWPLHSSRQRLGSRLQRQMVLVGPKVDETGL